MRNEISGDFITELERNVYYSNNKHKDTDGNFFLLERRYNENETKKSNDEMLLSVENQGRNEILNRRRLSY